MTTWVQARRLFAAVAGAPATVLRLALRRTRRGADATALELRQLVLQLEAERARLVDAQAVANALRESDEKFRQLADHITDAFWIRSADMRTLYYISPAFERIWGRSVESLYANPSEWADFIAPQDRARVLAAFDALAEDSPLDVEYRITRPDGQIRWVRVRGFRVRDAAGAVIRHSGIVTDITEHKRTEAALQESEGRYRALVEWSPEPIAVTRGGTILFVNPAAVSMMGASSDRQLLGMSVLDLVQPEVRQRVLEGARPVTSIGDAMPLMEERVRRLDGTLIDVEVRATSIVYNGEPAVFSSMRDITENKRAAEALRTSVEEFRTLAEAVPQMVWITRPDGWNLYFNQQWRDYTGLTREESIGHGWHKAFHPADQQRARDAWDDAIATISTYSLECLLRRADGVYRWWLIRGAPVLNGAGIVQKWFGTCTDIHDLKLAELQIARTNRALTMLSSSAGVSGGDTAFFGQLVANMAGALGAQGAFLSELLPGTPLIARTIAAQVEGTVIQDFDYAVAGTFCERLLSSDSTAMSILPGALCPGELARAAPGARGYVGRRLAGSAGQPLGLLFAVFQELPEDAAFVTKTLQIFAARAASELERQQTDAQVREQAALLDIAHEAIMVEELDGRLVYWNKGAERTFGWSAAEALGRSSVEMLYDDPEHFHGALAALHADGEWQGEVVKRTKDGRAIPVDVRWTLVRDAHDRPHSILEIDTDISERKALEARFLRAQRLESIGTLAGGIAHDLNNMLTPILMSVDMLREFVTDESGLALLATMQSSAQRGADLVQQVLSFARGVEGQRITVNPLHLMRDLLKVMHDSFPKSIEVRLTPGPGLWTVTGDPTQIHQVFMNLCVNARDAMAGGGQLVVTMDNIRLDDGQCSRLNADAHPGAYVKVHVQDDGIGIPPAMRDRIFEPFFTTKAIGEGTGLGLSTTVAIVRSHGGFIQLESEVGVGTTFDVYLPANTAEAAVEIDAVPRLGPTRGNGELVLVVDDEDGILRVAQRWLERSGYRTLLASDGAVGLSMYIEHQRDIAVVLTDMAMPVMDGPALILALKALNPDVRIVGSSGLTSMIGIARAADTGAGHFLPKPYTGNALLEVLQTALKPAAPPPESR
jgi:PAS domain S-box-containing protein